LEFKEIKNIIFDLGGVIINLDMDRTARAFAEFTGKSLKEVQDRIATLNIFYKYEVGELNDQEFRNLVREFIGSEITDQQIDQSWNALLLDIPKERIELIKNLGKQFRIFILSNTNLIHFVEVEKILEKHTGVSSLSAMFEKVYLSYEMGMCKPHPGIYQYVLKNADLKASETLFIDDNLNNIEGASQLGIKTIHLQPPTTILDIFDGAKFS